MTKTDARFRVTDQQFLEREAVRFQPPVPRPRQEDTADQLVKVPIEAWNRERQ
jgi:hypothetical protein